MEGGAWQELPFPVLSDVMTELDAPLLLEGTGKAMELLNADRTLAGSISVNKSRITFRSLTLPLASDIHVERSDVAVGADADRISLREFIDQNDAFIALFDVPELAYIGGTLYRDEAMTSGGAAFLRHLVPEGELATVTSEKGQFTAAQTEFDRNSTFGVVIRAVSAGDDVLVCDDLGDEWADFIGLRTDPLSPRVTFYHAKHGDLSLGASPFHASVGQAIKNLGNLALHPGRMPNKIRGWEANYNNDGEHTAIPRITRGRLASLSASFTECREAPNVARRVAIVTSSLSKSALADAFDAIQTGARPDPHFVQLYWLLASFFSACSEVGAFGYVVCQT